MSRSSPCAVYCRPSQWCRPTARSRGRVASDAGNFPRRCAPRPPLNRNVMCQPRRPLGLWSRMRRRRHVSRRRRNDHTARLGSWFNGRMLAGTEKRSPSLGQCSELGSSSVGALVDRSQVVHQAVSVRNAHQCRRAKAWHRNAPWVALRWSALACCRWRCPA